MARTNLLNDPILEIVNGLGEAGATASDVWANLPDDVRQIRTERGVANALLILTETGNLTRQFEYETSANGGMYRRLRYWSRKHSPLVGVQSGPR